MRKMEFKKLVMISYGGLIASILSIFTTIVSYTNVSGTRKTFSVIDFISSYEFDYFVLPEYIGNVVVTIDIQIIRVLVVIGIAAIICAFLGIATLSKQKKNMWPFVLTLAGLIGTMIPSVIIFIAVLFLKSQYMGTLSCGIYPVVTPIAMIISMVTATQMHRRNQEYIKKMEAAEGLIFRGGDL